jgi:DNA-binding IclR family transcriptional regulator
MDLGLSGKVALVAGDFDLDGHRAALELGMLAHIGLVRAALPHLKRAGERAGFITGTVQVMDGGRAMGV